MRARMAAIFVRAMSATKFPDDAIRMETMTVDWLASIDCAVSAGSHKYVPTERLNADLGLPDGAGVFGYRKYDDGSYLLLTCDHGVAVWSGSPDERAEFGRSE